MVREGTLLGRVPVLRRFRLGLRDRVMLAFGLLALALSVLLATLAWTFVSRYLVDQRESTAVVETSINVAALQRGLSEHGPSIPTLLDALPASDGAASVLSYGGQWYATSITRGPSQLPHELIRTVAAGTSSTQRIAVDGQPFLVVGMPLERTGDSYFELFPLAELDRTFRVLSITLVVAAAMTALVGLAVGRMASKRALRPLAELTKVAAAVARGQLDARLHAEQDPDLGGLARSFNHTAAALEQRVIADARFAGDVSHELRTPLTTMLNSMQVIQNRRAELPPSVREPLELLADDLERFRRLVVDLLEISRHDGGVPLVRETVRIADLVRRAADAAAGWQVTTVTAEAGALVLQADKRRLERVVTNLVENAQNHGCGCTAVQVSAGGLGVRVEVDDAGPGIPPERRQRVFERFTRGGSGESQGVGLGLAIVARHVRVHGGTIGVEDRPGGGARFVVELPLDRGQP